MADYKLTAEDFTRTGELVEGVKYLTDDLMEKFFYNTYPDTKELEHDYPIYRKLAYALCGVVDTLHAEYERLGVIENMKGGTP